MHRFASACVGAFLDAPWAGGHSRRRRPTWHLRRRCQALKTAGRGPHIQAMPEIGSEIWPGRSRERTRRNTRQRGRPSPSTWGRCRLGTSPISIPAPESQAVQDDLEKAAAEAQRIKQSYQGKLAALAADGAALAEAIAAYESLSDTIGKLGSYAGLLYAADTSDPAEGEVLRRHPGQDHGHHHRPHLLRAGAQQDRGGNAGSRARGAGARPLQAVDRRPAQGQALPARGAARAPVPREVDHLAQRLGPALQRDDDGLALRGGRREEPAGARAHAQLPDVARRAQAATRRPRRWRRCSGTTVACSR